MTRSLSYNFKAVDMDLGEMFPNFPLHHSMRKLFGLDLTPFRHDIRKAFGSIPAQQKRFSATWSRLCFGWNESPEQAVTFYYLAEEFARGKHTDENNPLRWDKVVLNMIGNKDYNPALPNVYKWDSINNRIAGELLAYIDDLRALGFSLEHAWLIARWIASKLQYLGIQDAARKRRIDNGPWAGGVYNACNQEITKTVTQPKRDKGQQYVRDLLDEMTQNPVQNLDS